jgi:hypothetical protein
VATAWEVGISESGPKRLVPKSTHGCTGADIFMRWALQEPNSGKSSCPKSLDFWNWVTFGAAGPCPNVSPDVAL